MYRRLAGYMIIMFLLSSALIADIRQLKFYEGSFTVDNPLPWAGDEEVNIDIPELSIGTQSEQLNGVFLCDVTGMDVEKDDGVYRIALVDPTGPSLMVISYPDYHSDIGVSIVEYRGGGLKRPTKCVFGPSNKVYVIDIMAKAVFVFQVEEDTLRKVGAFGSGVIKAPVDIDYSPLDGGFIVVLDRKQRSLIKFSLNGDYIGRSGPQKVPIFNPGGIAVGKKMVRDSWGALRTVSTDEIYITENDFKRIVRVKGDFLSNPEVQYFYLSNLPSSSYLGDIETDQFGGYFFVDESNGAIYAGYMGNVDGPFFKNGGNAFRYPRDIALLGDQLFVSEYMNRQRGVSRFARITTLDTFFLYGPDSIIPTKEQASFVFSISDWGRVSYEVIDSITGEVKLSESEIESPGYHFRVFDGVGNAGTLPDGAYKLRIIVRSLFGERDGIDPPDTGMLYVRVYQSENYHVFSKGATGATFFHDDEHLITRVLDTSSFGNLSSSVVLFEGYNPSITYYEGSLSNDESCLLSPHLSSNDSTLLFALPLGVGIVKDPLFFYDTTQLQFVASGKYPVISPCGDKIAYLKNHYIIVKDLKSGHITESFPAPYVRFLSFHPYHNEILYAKGGDLFVHKSGRDSLVFHTDSGEIEEAQYFPDGVKILLLIKEGEGEKIALYDPVREHVITIEQINGIRGISATWDGRFITYSQGKYVVGFPAGKRIKEPRTLLASPLVGNGMEEKIRIRGSVENNTSQNADTVYAHLDHFKVEWGYGEYPSTFRSDGVFYPHGQGAVNNDILAEVVPMFKTDTISIKLTSYSTEGDSAIRYVWGYYSPLRVRLWGNYSTLDTIDSYFDTLHIAISMLDTSNVKMQKIEILSGKRVVYVINTFKGPVHDSDYTFFADYDLRDSTGRFLEGDTYSVLVYATWREDTVLSLKKTFHIKHMPLISDNIKATYPPQAEHLEVIHGYDGNTAYVAYLSKYDVFFAKTTLTEMPQKRGNIKFLEDTAQVKPLSNRRIRDYYPSILLDSIKRDVFVLWGDDVGVLHLCKIGIDNDSVKEYKVEVGGHIIYTNMAEKDTTIYIVYGGTVSKEAFYGVLSFENGRFNTIRKWNLISKLYPPDIQLVGQNLYLMLKNAKDLFLYHIPSWERVNITKELEDTLPNDTFDIVNYAMGTRYMPGDDTLALAFLLSRKNKEGLAISLLKDTAMNTVFVQKVDSEEDAYTECVISDGFMDIVARDFTGGPFEYMRWVFSWDDYSGQWSFPGGDDNLTHSIFRNGVYYGGTYFDYLNGPSPVSLIGIRETMLKDKKARHSQALGTSGRLKYHFFGVYPNPARDNVVFRFILPEEGRVRLRLYTVDGRCIKGLDKKFKAGLHEIDLNRIVPVQKMPEGVYFYSFSYKDKRKSGKFVLIKHK